MLKDRPQTRKALLERLESQREAMRQHATVLPPEQAEERRRRSESDFLFFCETYVPHYFTNKPAAFHKELRDEANQPGINALAAPRGFAKSVIITFADTLYDCVHGRVPFTIIVKETHEAAIDEVASIQIELEENPRILADFGMMKKRGEWEDGDFTTTTGCRVLALGIGQSLRGKKHRQHRPGKIKIDDPEKDKVVRNPRLNKERVEWAKEACYPALTPKTGVLSWYDTLKSRRSGLAMLMDEAKKAGDSGPTINVRVWAAIDKSGKSLWPDRFSLKDLAATRALVGLKAWLQEYMNAPSDDPGATFQQSMIRTYREDEVGPPDNIAGVYAACDPSLTETKKSDFKAIVTIRVVKRLRGQDGPFYLITRPWVRQDTIDAMLRHFFVVGGRESPARMGMEIQGGQILLLRDIRRMERERGVRLPVIGIKQSVSKEARISRLSLMMERGVLLFPEAPDDIDTQELITQFLGFDDDAVNDDGPDACEMAVKLAERKGGGASRVKTW